MDLQRALQVLRICLPVFALIGLGRLLSRRGPQARGVLTEEHCAFVNWIVYNLALPALIFREVAALPFSRLLNGALWLAPLAGAVVISVLYALYARVRGLRGGLRAAVIFGTFWANTAYMGFPLVRSAFGGDGLGLAAVYNAIAFPAFVCMGQVLLTLCSGKAGGHWLRKFRSAFVNPVVLAGIAGILVSLAADFRRTPEGVLVLPGWLTAAFTVVDDFLKLLGSMGLPLALLMIGATLRLGEVRGRWEPLCATVLGKLVLCPLIVWLLLRLFYAGAAPIVVGVVVVLSAMPTAVASYVIARQAQVEESFVSAVLVVSTLASVVTVPVWLYVVL